MLSSAPRMTKKEKKKALWSTHKIKAIKLFGNIFVSKGLVTTNTMYQCKFEFLHSLKLKHICNDGK